MIASHSATGGEDIGPAAAAARLVGSLRDVDADAQIALAWRDPVLGDAAGGCPAAVAGIAAAVLAGDGEGDRGDGDGPDWRFSQWQPAGAQARMVLAWRCRGAVTPAWLAAARALVETELAAARMRLRIGTLEKTQRLQQALYEIADLASTDLEMPRMLRGIHDVLGSLMYAENCYIVEYEASSERMRFLYFADQRDDFVADSGRHYAPGDVANSLTLALLRHGKPLLGPPHRVREQLNLPRDPGMGPDSLDWLGVPMLRDGQVCGAIVVQSYERGNCYDDADRVLLGYVAQHVLTALDRRQAKDTLEAWVQERTAELREANRVLQEEIAERRRAEQLQRALFEISELAMSSASLDAFYAQVHAVVGRLLDASNFYIALVNAAGDGLEFAYSVDEHHQVRPPRRFSAGLTEYVIARREPVLADRQDLDRLAEQGVAHGFGKHAYSWLGIPLTIEGEVVGVIAVQSYSPAVRYSADDRRLLMFVAQNIGNGLARQRGQEQLRRAHTELERRVEERTRELAELNQRLRGQIGERLHAERKLIHQALHDSLTGLPNRAHLLDRMAAAIVRAGVDPRQGFAVLFLDLDRFKLVNDSIGHAAGDRMLVKVAKRIVCTVREEDVVARLGGDEFAILVSHAGSIDDVRELAARLQQALGKPMWIDGRELFPAGSLGIAMWHPRYGSGEELLRDADAAMYRAKALGQDRCVVFDEAMREAALRSLDLEADLRRAINSGHFVAHYQPIVRLADGAVIGHEALLRWNHESRGTLLPGEFIELGEESGLIEQVDWLLYEQVVQRLAADTGDGYLAVNVSPRHFRSGGFAARLLDMLSRAGADPGRLRVEITEVALMDDSADTMYALRELRRHGVLIQLDDFGTGYSALSYLHRFPISVLKVDRSFVAGLNRTEQNTRVLVRGVLALAATLGLETIGEGIETAVQRQVLQDLGCHYGQGYLLGRPLSQPLPR